MPKNSYFDYNPKYGLTDINRFLSFSWMEEYPKDIKYNEEPTPLVVLTDNQTLLGYNEQRSESNRPNEIRLVDKNGKNNSSLSATHKDNQTIYITYSFSYLFLFRSLEAPLQFLIGQHREDCLSIGRQVGVLTGEE